MGLLLSELPGITSCALVAAGCWSLWGWEWAALVVGGMGVMLYLVRTALGLRQRREVEP